MKKGKAGLGLVLTAILLAVMIAVGCVVNTYAEQISYWWSGTFTEPMTKAEYTADDALENGRAVSIEQVNEGVVLLENKNNALPLKDSERSVSLIGYGSHNPIYCGAGSVSWNYGMRAKVDPFFAQVWNPLHGPDELREYPKEVTELDV